MEELPRHREPMVVQTYNYTVYTVMSGTMDRIALSLSRMLQEAGYGALPVPVTQTVDKVNFEVSFRRSWRRTWPDWVDRQVVSAGDAGSRHAGPLGHGADRRALAPGKPLDQRCGACKLCVEACPVARSQVGPSWRASRGASA